MKHKVFKITILMLIFLMLIFSAKECFAFGVLGSYYTSRDTAMDIDVKIGSTDEIGKNNDMTSKLLGWVQVIGSIASVIALAIIGIRYMISSAEEKANMKGILIYYIIGAALVFGTSNILSIVYNVIRGIE